MIEHVGYIDSINGITSFMYMKKSATKIGAFSTIKIVEQNKWTRLFNLARYLKNNNFIMINMNI